MRAYDAENRVFARRKTPLTMDEARDLAGKLFAHFGVEPIVVKRTIRRHPHRAGGSWFRHPYKGKPGWIALDLIAPDWVVCHEVAHYAAWEMHGHAIERGHGHRWAALYVEAVRVRISQTYADRLTNAFIRVGLMLKEPR